MAFKPLTLQGLNACIYANLRDARCLDFENGSSMGSVETSLSHGPTYFNSYPNLSLALDDMNLLDSVSLYVQTKGYNYAFGSRVIALVYKIHFKIMTTLAPQAKKIGTSGQTALFETNFLTSRVAMPKVIEWEKICLPQKWVIENVVPPQPIINNQIEQITQTEEGTVEVSFAPFPKRLSRNWSSSSRSGRFPYKVEIPQSSRPSTSQVPADLQESVRGIHVSQNNIPHEIYQNNSEIEESQGGSPTLTDLRFQI